MARTRHHSQKWGPNHRFADRKDRGYGMSRRAVGEAPGWYVRLFEHRPGRRADRILLTRLVRGEEDPDAICFERTGGRKPHRYYW